MLLHLHTHTCRLCVHACMCSFLCFAWFSTCLSASINLCARCNFLFDGSVQVCQLSRNATLMQFSWLMKTQCAELEKVVFYIQVVVINEELKRWNSKVQYSVKFAQPISIWFFRLPFLVTFVNFLLCPRWPKIHSQMSLNWWIMKVTI